MDEVSKAILKMNITIMITVIFTINFVYMSTSAFATAENLVVNGDFSNGLFGWTPYTWMNVGSWSINTVTDGVHPEWSPTLEYKRWDSGSDGGVVMIYQDLNICVEMFRKLYVEFDVLVLEMPGMLPDSGWYSYQNGGHGEWPALVRITYEDEYGNTWDWVHGFLHQEDFYGRKNYDVVTFGRWYHYRSPNLLNITTTLTEPGNVPVSSPPPKIIKRIYVGGQAWDFNGRFDNIKIIWYPSVGGIIVRDTLEDKLGTPILSVFLPAVLLGSAGAMYAIVRKNKIR
ncbi:MAG: hypothetical protein QXD04_00385 [Candidatus Bathyarchaeia archaeon]